MKNSNEFPMVFNFDTNNAMRSLLIESKPWFVANDICNVIGLYDTRRAIQNLDDDEKLTGKILQSGQRRKMWLVNESGLYALIMRSNKPEAKKFRKWVTSEVLPAIRKTGRYEKPEPGNVAASYIDEAIKVAGSMRALAGRIGVSPASLSQIKKRPHLFDGAYIGQVITACSRVVKRRGSVDMDSMGMLMQVEDKDIRLGLWSKMRKGGLL